MFNLTSQLKITLQGLCTPLTSDTPWMAQPPGKAGNIGNTWWLVAAGVLVLSS